MAVLFSGSAPSGMLTIGNYIGALRQWKQFEQEYNSIFCIVDLHAITTPHDAGQLRTQTLDFLALYVACGLDPRKSTIFIQSQNPYHTELTWILNSCTGFGDLSRMTQFKDKSSKQKVITAGLFNYPILMAADILLYNTSFVPVGEDQMQHIEITRRIAERFNATYGEVFTIPEGFTPEVGKRIRSLIDPSRKMDKSDPNPRAYISLLDTPDEVATKIRKAKTDSIGSFPVDDSNEGITNLLNIFSVLSGESMESLVSRYGGGGYGAVKNDLVDCMIEFLKPLQAAYHELRAEDARMEALMRQGAEKAIEMARPNIRRIKEVVGLPLLA